MRTLTLASIALVAGCVTERIVEREVPVYVPAEGGTTSAPIENDATASSDATTDATTDGPTDGSFDAAFDAGDAADGNGDTCPVNVSLTEADLDKEPGWKAALAAANACTAGDINQIEANFKNTVIKTYFELGTGVSQSCFDCVFSNDTDADWGPIIGTASNNGETGFINFGACFGVVESEACGKALQYEQFCFNTACNACTTTSSERQICVEKAGSTGMCKDFGARTMAACPNIQTSAKQCNSVFDAIKTLCGPK